MRVNKMMVGVNDVVDEPVLGARRDAVRVDAAVTPLAVPVYTATRYIADAGNVDMEVWHALHALAIEAVATRRLRAAKSIRVEYQHTNKLQPLIALVERVHLDHNLITFDVFVRLLAIFVY